MKRLSRLAVLFGLAASPLLWAAESPLILDPEHSSIEAVVKSTTDNFTAKLTTYTATITVDPAQKRVTTTQIAFHFNDVKTSNAKRDVEMLHWEQADQFPDAVYTLATLQPGTDGTFTAHGKFNLHGVTKEITFPLTISLKTPDHYAITGELPLDTRDFGLPVIRKFAVLKVNPLLQIKFHLEGRVAPSS